MILLFVILCLIFALIILTIFVFITIKSNNKYVAVNYIDHCKSPTIIGYTNNGIYTNKIKNKKDKILIVFESGNDVNATFLNSSTFQILDKKNIVTIFKDTLLHDFLLFSINYNLCLSTDNTIVSLFNKLTYSINFKDFSIFEFNDELFIFTPSIIKKINSNFIPTDDYFSLKSFFIIKSNPILINGLFWIIASENNILFFIIFDMINKKIINIIEYDIDFQIGKGLIYNSFNDTFHIPIIKNNKIHIFNITKNDVLSKI